jgi:hypothetical protein
VAVEHPEAAADVDVRLHCGTRSGHAWQGEAVLEMPSGGGVRSLTFPALHHGSGHGIVEVMEFHVAPEVFGSVPPYL